MHVRKGRQCHGNAREVINIIYSEIYGRIQTNVKKHRHSKRFE